MPSSPLSDQAAYTQGEWYEAPCSRTTSPGCSSSAAPSSACPVGAVSAMISWSPLHPRCIAHTSPRRKPKPGVPATVKNGLSCPVRPWRCARLRVPDCSSCRCGRRSKLQRPPKSSNSRARAGRGRVTPTRFSDQLAALSFVTEVHERSTPSADNRSSMSTERRTPESRLPEAPPPGCNPADSSGPDESRMSTPSATRDRPTRENTSGDTMPEPLSAGVPPNPSPKCGSTLSRTGRSTAL